jgi:hypothetical protein
MRRRKRSQFLFVLMVFNATFNNISVILWWSVLLVEEHKPIENASRGCHGRDLMVVGYTATNAISAYHH